MCACSLLLLHSSLMLSEAHSMESALKVTHLHSRDRRLLLAQALAGMPACVCRMLGAGWREEEAVCRSLVPARLRSEEGGGAVGWIIHGAS